ncbi:MAG: flagellar hook-length control protein FliK [Desulfurivibrio sp.]|nr:flagellar hook-length control protein FliK [Desulfurivibrio sp.]
MKLTDLVQAPRLAGDQPAKASPARPAGAGPALEAGSLLKGRVAGFTDDGRVLLELAGQRIAARTSVPLTPGREIWFEVRQGGNDPWLTLADKQGGVHRFLQQASGGLRDFNRLGELLQNLKGEVATARAGGAAAAQQAPDQAMNQTTGQAAAGGTAAAGGQATAAPPPGGDPASLLARLLLGSAPAPDKIVRLVTMLRADGSADGERESGGREAGVRPWGGASAARQPVLNLPSQLQALAAAARLQAQGSAALGGGASPAESAEAAGRDSLAALGRIGGILEAMTALNEQPAPANQPPFWLLPVFFALDAGAGSWLLSLDQDEESGEEESTLIFFLEMSRLGELQLKVKIRGERLEGDFMLTQTGAADFLRGRLEELRQRLEALGYQAVFRCHQQDVPLLPTLKAELEKAAGGRPRKLIDIQA